MGNNIGVDHENSFVLFRATNEHEFSLTEGRVSQYPSGLKCPLVATIIRAQHLWCKDYLWTSAILLLMLFASVTACLLVPRLLVYYEYKQKTTSDCTKRKS